MTARSDARFLHWNMGSPQYGFNALTARYEYWPATQVRTALGHRLR